MATDDIEVVALAIWQTTWPGETLKDAGEAMGSHARNEARAAITAYNATPRRQAEQAVVEAALKLHHAYRKVAAVLNKDGPTRATASIAVASADNELGLACARLAELESGDG